MFHAFYIWLYDPDGFFSFLRLFNYLTSRAIFAVITSFFFVVIAGRPMIRALYQTGLRDTVRLELFASTDQKKAGTPTMGGLILLLATLLSSFFWCDLSNRFIQILLFASVWFAALGYLDDSRKIRFQDSGRGLSRGKKYLGQVLYGLLFSVVFLHPTLSPLPAGMASKLFLPFYKHPIVDLSWAYALVILVSVVYAANAINFADGMDGLAIVPCAYVVGVYGAFAYVMGNARHSHYLMFDFFPGAGEITIFCAVLVGACVGFLWFNSYPAEVFMGDTGSMFLGGVVGTLIVLLKQELLFLIVGGIFLAEILSVTLQDWLGIQRIGKRFLYRAPIHDCFQYMGLSETKITVRLWIISGMLALLGLASLKIR
ncbi:MAG: phospho-N-acetylmuramoyl-pentapeptide-transferase [bacterium]